MKFQMNPCIGGRPQTNALAYQRDLRQRRLDAVGDAWQVRRAGPRGRIRSPNAARRTELSR